MTTKNAIYLVKVMPMMTSDECDCTVTGEFEITQDQISDQAHVGQLVSKLASRLMSTLITAPLTNIHPMTADEVTEWRKDENERMDSLNGEERMSFEIGSRGNDNG